MYIFLSACNNICAYIFTVGAYTIYTSLSLTDQNAPPKVHQSITLKWSEIWSTGPLNTLQN